MKSFSMGELMPFLTELTDQYTSKESTSVSYEKARQLMGAVLYFINEAGKEKPARQESVCESAFQSPKVLPGDKTPRELYDRGKLLVIERVQEASRIYGSILPEFHAYGVRCYQETVIQGLPEFFQKYDARYNPQDHILTLDYPVLGTMGNLKGVDAIIVYLERIYLEQQFLHRFPDELVIKSMEDFYGDYEELFINPGQILMRGMVCRLIAEELKSQGEAASLEGTSAEGGLHQQLEQLILEENEHRENTENTDNTDRGRLRRKVTKHIGLIVLKLWRDDRRMAERLTGYLLADVPDFCTELVNAAKYDNLRLFFEM